MSLRSDLKLCKNVQKKSIKIVFSMKLIQLTEVSQFIQTIFKGEATNIKKLQNNNKKIHKN